jgi:hypothetical protein
LKILLDTCVWGGVRSALTEAGHDVIWAGDWSSDPGDEVCLAVLGTYAPYLEEGAIVTAEANRIRLRPADDDRE